MKRKTKIEIIIIMLLLISGIIFGVVDYERINNDKYPLFCLKIHDETYLKENCLGLGYNITRYISVQPLENLSQDTSVNFKIWFLKAKEIQYETKEIEQEEIKEEVEKIAVGTIIEKSKDEYIIEVDDGYEVKNLSKQILIKTDENFQLDWKVKVVYKGYEKNTSPLKVNLKDVSVYLVNGFSKAYIKQEEIPQNYKLEDAIRDGYFIVTTDKKYNETLYTQFLNNIEKGIPAFLRAITFTIEGDTIVEDIKFTTDKKIELAIDYTRDNYLNETDRIYKNYIFDNISIYIDETGEYLYAYNGDELNGEIIKTENAFLLLKLN